MNTVIEFLIENYIYFLFVAILLVLALIGYIIDSSKTARLKKELAKRDEETIDIPIAKLGENVKIGEAVNKVETGSNVNVNTDSAVKPVDNPTIASKTEEKK